MYSVFVMRVQVCTWFHNRVAVERNDHWNDASSEPLLHSVQTYSELSRLGVHGHRLNHINRLSYCGGEGALPKETGQRSGQVNIAAAKIQINDDRRR